MLLGLSLASCGAYTGITTFESGFGPRIGLVLLLFGVSLVRHAYRLLAADADGAERLTVRLGVIAGPSGVAIGAMVAQADFATDAARTQVVGFAGALILPGIAPALCSHHRTRSRVRGGRRSTGGGAPRIGRPRGHRRGRAPDRPTPRSRRGHVRTGRPRGHGEVTSGPAGPAATERSRPDRPPPPPARTPDPGPPAGVPSAPSRVP
ncbi:hypothetical protein ACH4OX_08410 [Streptomyces roseolus]|uniref:hypothetical protein n=1 Tax=Streptomyces roseolus TaxID=67358 RepID=UPI0037B9B51A